MDTEDKLIVCVALTVITAVISIPWAVAWHDTTTTRAALESGYEQQTLPGQTGVHWVKVGEKNDTLPQ